MCSASESVSHPHVSSLHHEHEMEGVHRKVMRSYLYQERHSLHCCFVLLACQGDRRDCQR